MKDKKAMPVMEFHVSRKARDLYDFDDALFSLSGNVLFANFHAARLFAHKMNEKRDLVAFPEQAVRAGQINAIGLIDEILHYVVSLFRNQRNAKVMKEALDWLCERVGKNAVDRTLHAFVDQFPSVRVYRDEIVADAYLDGETEGTPHREIALEEMLMLWLANMNPAFSPFLELFDDGALERETDYVKIASELHAFFDKQPCFGPDNQNLVEMLRSPVIAFPHSLSGQLEYIRERWGFLLGSYFYRLLGSLDVIKEDEIAEQRRMTFWGHTPAEVYQFAGMETEPERFSPDLHWMPRVVVLAKNIYVWLHQLSKKYRQSIYRLDEVPDEELDLLSRWGFTGLWLIGLWERSLASKKIKELLGNPDAVASAYSLFDYQIAGDLGGEEAFRNLRERALSRSIRLASDMVPNHVGIDSRWVMEHPDWFVSLGYSPFPSYRFGGPDLSWNGEAGIYLEDHYMNRSDAAVVFKRVDRRNGEERYIYHGNDGTRMPWNDTAQLNYLKPEVREAVIQKILDVASKFPIIRFDAAMTLTKRHYQRLWYPEPGTGGAIPSRADYGMTKDEFNRAMPEEFWREVVDRVARDAPDTLLLAEAFWLLEGFFVRTLGMHRVYNSAFMNMLKDEENAKYRSVIKNTLEFNPEVLKRFVNFMSNPDEETAVAQFGKGDKYFGICTMMVTMPGLPMFAHGQVEGFAEKYGMEYRSAKWDETPDGDFIRRHEREIFPLMKRRPLFSDVAHFLLYDFFTPEGTVNENVFCYSNRNGDEVALMVYHNRYESARGWVRSSAAYSVKAGESEERVLVRRDLGEGLALHAEDNYFCIFADHATGLEYIRNSNTVCREGLYVELGAYRYHVFLSFREVRDDASHQYSELARYLNGRGVPSIEEALREMFFQPIHVALKEVLNREAWTPIFQGRHMGPGIEPDFTFSDVDAKGLDLLKQAKRFSGGTGDEQAILRQIKRELQAAVRLPAQAQRCSSPLPDETFFESPDTRAILCSWLWVHLLGKVVSANGFEERSRSWIDEWRLSRTIADLLKELGKDDSDAWRSVLLIRVLTTHQRWFEDVRTSRNREYRMLETLFKDEDVRQFVRVNRYNEVLWLNKDAFGQLLEWLFLVAAIGIESDVLLHPPEKRTELQRCASILEKWNEQAGCSKYQVEKLLEAAKGSSPLKTPLGPSQ
jgi:glycosidase